MKSNFLTLKSIRVGFDIITAFMMLLICSFIAMNVFTIWHKPKEVIGVAAIHPDKETILFNENLVSDGQNVDLKIQPKYLEVEYDLNFAHNSTSLVFYRILTAFTLNLSLLFSLFIVFQLRNIINSVLKEMKHKGKSLSHHVFSRKNIQRLRYLAFAFILFPLIELSAYWADNLLLERYVKITGTKVMSVLALADLSWDYILIGLVFIILIEVIHKGIALQEENDLTV
jgi:hypothetical protein